MCSSRATGNEWASSKSGLDIWKWLILQTYLIFFPAAVRSRFRNNHQPKYSFIYDIILIDLSHFHPGLLWAVCLSCSTRETGWAQESETVPRMSLLPALTSSSSWRNTATGRWASTVSDTHQRSQKNRSVYDVHDFTCTINICVVR